MAHGNDAVTASVVGGIIQAPEGAFGNEIATASDVGDIIQAPYGAEIESSPQGSSFPQDQISGSIKSFPPGRVESSQQGSSIAIQPPTRGGESSQLGSQNVEITPAGDQENCRSAEKDLSRAERMRIVGAGDKTPDNNKTPKRRFSPEALTPVGRLRKRSTAAYNSPELRDTWEFAFEQQKNNCHEASTDFTGTAPRHTITPRRRLPVDNIEIGVRPTTDGVAGIKSIGEIPKMEKLSGPIVKFKSRSRTASLSTSVQTKASQRCKKRNRTLSSGVQKKITDSFLAQSKISKDASEMDIESIPSGRHESQ